MGTLASNANIKESWVLSTLTLCIPGMVYNDLGPIAAIKKSVDTLKKTWGESLVRIYGLGIIEIILIVLGVVVGLIMLFTIGMISAYMSIAVVAVTAIYILFVIILFSVANSIFNTALFYYAEKGKVPQGYSEDIMQGTFAKKEKR